MSDKSDLTGKPEGRDENPNQHELFEDILPPVWQESWRGMPKFDHEEQRSWHSIKVHFKTQEHFDEFRKAVGQKIGPGQRSMWFPEATIDRYSNKRYTSTSIRQIKPRFPIYIVSKGRAKKRLTGRYLDHIRVPYRVVVEPQEFAEYCETYNPAMFAEPGEKVVGMCQEVLVLPEGNQGQGSIPARNWVWQHAVDSGHSHHWILDDNISQFCLFNRNLKTPVSDGAIFRIAEDFAVDRYENVGLSGFNYFHFITRKSGRYPPYYLNTRIYSCILIRNDLPLAERWRGIYNEDTDLSLRVLKSGLCTVLFNAFLCDKTATMTMRGGNTDKLYAGDERDDDLPGSGPRRAATAEARLEMARSLQLQHPELVTITEKWGRPQHQVDYRPFRRTKLVPRPGYVVPEGDDAYGLEFIDLG